MRPHKKTIPILLLTAAMALGPAAAAPAADAFYLEVLREGDFDLRSGNYERAAKNLRIACFGLLDEPDLLAEGLVRLALTQGYLGDRSGFAATFRRLAEVEERFGAYGSADIPQTLRTDFEDRAIRWIPAAELGLTAGFRPMAARQTEERLVAMSPDQRRGALEQLLKEDPENPRWYLQLARLELDADRAAQAATWAGRLLETYPNMQEGHCLRGLARAEMGECPGAVADLGACQTAATDLTLAQAGLECLVELGDADGARALVDALAPTAIAQPRIAKLTRKLERLERRAAGGRPPVTGPAVADSEPPAEERPVDNRKPAPPPEQEPEPPALSALDAATLDNIRRELPRTHSVERLQGFLAQVRALASRYPHLPEVQHLAGELAYRSSRWEEAASYFTRGGDPGNDRPDLLFYMAVALYQSGSQTEGAEILKRALPNLKGSPFIQSWADRILGSG